MLALAFCSSLLAVAPETTPAEVRRAYQDARLRSGRTPEGQVRLALWCEARGLTAERLKHLALAVVADPTNATARGLMGLVAYQGGFLRPEAIAEQARGNPALAEYESRRAKAPYTAEGQWSMGVWADEHGLKDQARAHFTAVTRLDPTRDRAWRRLGYIKRGARWTTDARVAAEKLEADARKQADKKWRPLLDQYRTMLDQPARRAEAEAALAAIADPHAVPAILATFVAGRRADPARAVQLLGQVDSPTATRALASLAVSSRSAPARRSAVETLRRRDPREFVRLWVGLIRDPIKYEVRPVGGPGSPGVLVVEGRTENLRRVYTPAAPPNLPDRPGMTLETDADGLPVLVEDLGSREDPNGLGGQIVAPPGYLQPFVAGLPAATASQRNAAALVGSSPIYQSTTREEQLRIPIGQMIRETERSAAVARQQLADDVASIERTNAAVRRSNEPALIALREITGQDLGGDAVAWLRWWTDHQGYALAEEPPASPVTVTEDVPIAYTPQAAPYIATGPSTTTTAPIPRTTRSNPIVVAPAVNFVYAHHSCFGAGTAVRTIKGGRAIESIRAGDLVLAQDPKTGALAYQPVVAAFHNPPAATLRVRLGDEAVVATGIHRFWKAGQGWTMARDLKPGDAVRVLGGVARVESVEGEQVRPVFNLEVAEGHGFLVGKLGALVHDNSPIEPTLAPFDTAAAP